MDAEPLCLEPRIIMLTCHVLVDSAIVPDKGLLLKPIQETLGSTFGIHHMTIQLETECEEEHALHCDLGYLTNGPTSKPAFPHIHHH